MNIRPFKISEPRLVGTIFGVIEVPGPFADDYTRLDWQYDDHWSGETAKFQVAGLLAYVQDRDGDDSWWMLKDTRTRKVIAEGRDSGFDPPNFYVCLVKAEEALRAEVEARKVQIRRRLDLAP